MSVAYDTIGHCNWRQPNKSHLVCSLPLNTCSLPIAIAKEITSPYVETTMFFSKSVLNIYIFLPLILYWFDNSDFFKHLTSKTCTVSCFKFLAQICFWLFWFLIVGLHSPTRAPPPIPKTMETHKPAAWWPPWLPTVLFTKSPSKSNVLINLGEWGKERERERMGWEKGRGKEIKN